MYSVFKIFFKLYDTRTTRSILPGIDISALYYIIIYYTGPATGVYYIIRRSKSGTFVNKSGHPDIACISGIIPENPGRLAGMTVFSHDFILSRATYIYEMRLKVTTSGDCN